MKTKESMLVPTLACGTPAMVGTCVVDLNLEDNSDERLLPVLGKIWPQPVGFIFSVNGERLEIAFVVKDPSSKLEVVLDMRMSRASDCVAANRVQQRIVLESCPIAQ